MRALRLVNARVWRPDEGLRDGDLHVLTGRVAHRAPQPVTVDLGGRVVVPGFVNGHDHLDFGSFPALGTPPYTSLYAWAEDVRAGAGDPAAAAGLAVPVLDRLFLGALRNLLCGVTTVAHHGAFRRSFRALPFRLAALARHGVWSGAGFPVQVLERYGWAHSPGLEADVPAARARTPAGAPFMLHAAEGTDARAAAEVASLDQAGLLGADTILVHGTAMSESDIARAQRAGAGVVWCPESNRHLYRAQPPIAALRAARVRVGLGSDSAASGVRDFLSTLALARHEAALGDDAALRLATHDTAKLLGLSAGRLAPGDAADFVVLDDLEQVLAGSRAGLALVVRAGRPLFGDAVLAHALGGHGLPLDVERRGLWLEHGFARLLARLGQRYPALRQLPWLRDVRLQDAPA